MVGGRALLIYSHVTCNMCHGMKAERSFPFACAERAGAAKESDNSGIFLAQCFAERGGSVTAHNGVTYIFGDRTAELCIVWRSSSVAAPVLCVDISSTIDQQATYVEVTFLSRIQQHGAPPSAAKTATEIRRCVRE